jgi:hypothetical protein
MLTGGLHLSEGEKKNKKGTGSVSFLGCGLRPAGLVLGPGHGPVGLVAFSSLLFFVLQPFLFSVFYFFHNFCKDASNQLKLLSEIF